MINKILPAALLSIGCLLSATAWATGAVRDFSATITASASGSGPAGGPITCTADMPPLTRVLARSVAPVKSSAMQPSSGMRAFLQKRGVPSLRR